MPVTENTYKKSTQRFHFWDESNRLRSTVVDGGKLIHNIYDASGERTLKAHSEYQGVFENGTPTDGGATLGSYTTYPSAYMTISRNAVYTKHYFAGTQRIASKPAGSANIFNALTESPDISHLKDKQRQDAQTVADSVDLGTLNFSGPIVEQINPAIYYFHPDHLGSSTVITDGAGYAYQIFLNLPFGETMAEQRRSGSLNNPFKFNGKELDSETGLYYYGARYYDPRISLFISVDPLAEQTMTPYQYTYQNPINLIDPTGMAAEDPDPPSKKKNALQRLRAKTTKWADDNIRQPIVKELKPYREYISIAREVNSEILKENLGPLYELQGMVGGSSPGYLVGGGVLGKTFKLNNSSKAKALKSMEPLVSFKNTDELLKAAGTINPTRSGNVHKNIIQASRDEVFESIIKGNIGTTPKGYYKMLDGKIIGKHPSPNGPTIDIKLPNNKLNNKIRFSHE